MCARLIRRRITLIFCWFLDVDVFFQRNHEQRRREKVSFVCRRDGLDWSTIESLQMWLQGFGFSLMKQFLCFFNFVYLVLTCLIICFNPLVLPMQVCVWCWHHIMDMAEKDATEGRCPACRTPYDKDRIVGLESNFQRYCTFEVC